ncbi:MAG: EAL domain-containing protein [Aquihabitans sp.]
MLTRDRAWLVVLAVGLTAVAIAAALGETAQLTIGLVAGLLTTVATGAVARRQRPGARLPWWLFACTAAGFVVAAATREILVKLEVSGAFPSPADALQLASYLTLIVAVYQFGSVRSAGRNFAAQVDAMIVAVAVTVVVWAVLLAPYIADATVPWNERALNATYSVLMTLTLAATARLAVSPGARTTPYYLIVAALPLLFFNDVIATLASVQGRETAWTLVFAPLVSILFTAAALHPRARYLLDPPSEHPTHLTRKRVTLLMTTLLIVPGLALWADQTDSTLDITVVVTGAVVLTGLVMGRITLLARSQERTMEVQQIQREANAAIASATTRQAMRRAALRAVNRLLDDGASRVAIARFVDETLQVVDASGYAAEQAIGTTIDIDRVHSTLAAGLTPLESSTVEATTPLDLAEPPLESTQDDGLVSLLVVPLSAQNQLTGALIVTTTRPVGPQLRQSIETLASTVSLALESATLTENLHRRRSERRFRALVENSSDIVLVVNEDRFITFASPAAHRLLGLSEQDLVGTHPARWVHPEDWAALATAFDAGTTPVRAGDAGLETRIRHIDGENRWFEIRTRDLRHEAEIEGLVVTASEITSRKATEQRLAESEARFRALVQNTTDVVAVVSEEGIFSYVSPAVTGLLGFTPEEVEGTPALAMLSPVDAAQFGLNYPSLADGRVEGALREQQVETRLRHRSGEEREVEIILTDMRDEPAVAGIVFNVRDVTVRKALERDLHYQSLHDNLTGLANRVMFTQQTALALQAAEPHGATIGALVIDIDDFKTVNDSLGHALGDQLLKLVATRLADRLPTADLVARLGGDEFAILVVDALSAATISDVAAQVQAIVADPFQIDGREIQVTCSVGMAMSADGSYDAEVLLRSADAAMYLAKERGKAGAAMYEDHLYTRMFERLELKADLARAVDDGQLRCHYQPIVSLQTGQITGLEALVRWEHPLRGLLSPDAFIGLAEDTGLIVPLGRWVLREACQQLREWQLKMSTGATLTMSVNLSVRQLASDSIMSDIRDAIVDTAIDPTTLTLEITESTLMHDTDVNQDRLKDLRALGLSLAVDDFGTGYSSLQYVQRFPIDIIKIDRSFVSGLGIDPGNGAVVQSMIELAQRLGVHTVAEGIEQPEQLAILQSLGADLAQGFLFSEPVPAEAIDALLAASPHENPRFILS